MNPSWRAQLALLGTFVACVHIGAFTGVSTLMERHGASMPAMIVEMDQVEYMRIADTLLDHGRFALSIDAAPEIFRTPGYPLLIAGISTLTGERYWSIFVLQGILVGFLAILVVLIARETGLSRRLSLIAGVLMGLSSGPLLLSLTGTGSDIPYTLLYSLAAYIAIRSCQRPLAQRAAMLGIILGLATLTRPIGIIASLPLLLGFAILHAANLRQYAHATMIALIAWLIVLAPWYARNAVVAGTPLLSTVSTFNIIMYNIPMNETFWRGVGEEESQITVLRAIGTTTPEALRSTTYLPAMKTYAREYLATHAAEYGTFHLYRTIPFFLMSGFNVANAIISHEAPSLRIPLFPTENENLTRHIAAHEWGAALRAAGAYWFTTLERLVWLVVIILALAAPLFAQGRTRRILWLFATVIITNIILVSPVTQARYRVPAEPFIWVAALTSISALARRWQGRRKDDMLSA